MTDLHREHGGNNTSRDDDQTGIGERLDQATTDTESSRPAGRDHHGGHGDHAAQFRDRFWLTLVLAVPVVIWSHHVQMLLGYTAPTVPGEAFIGPVLGSVIFFYGGWPFLTGGVSELRARRPGMMLLVTCTRSWRRSWPTTATRSATSRR